MLKKLTACLSAAWLAVSTALVTIPAHAQSLPLAATQGQTVNFTGSITGNQLTVTAVSSGFVLPGDVVRDNNGYILPGTVVASAAVVTASFAGNVMTVTANPTNITGIPGVLALGTTVSGYGVPLGTTITSYGTGSATPGALGTFNLSATVATVSTPEPNVEIGTNTSGGLTGTYTLINNYSFTASISGTTMTVTAFPMIGSLPLLPKAPGQTCGTSFTNSPGALTAVAAGTCITAFAVPTTIGGIGTYTVNNSQSVASEVMSQQVLSESMFAIAGGGGYVCQDGKLANFVGTMCNSASDFGAVPDNASDDTNALQAACDFGYATSPNRALVLAGGVYLTSKQLMCNIPIFMQPNTVIKVNPNVNPYNPISSVIQLGDVLHGAGYVEILGGTVDANFRAYDGFDFANYANIRIVDTLAEDQINYAYHLGNTALMAATVPTTHFDVLLSDFWTSRKPMDSFSGYIVGNNLYVTSLASSNNVPIQFWDNVGVAGSSQFSIGQPYPVGTVIQAQTGGQAFTASITAGTSASPSLMTVTGSPTGILTHNMVVYGAGLPLTGEIITSNPGDAGTTGTGSAGTYFVYPPLTSLVSSEAMTGGGGIGIYTINGIAFTATTNNTTPVISTPTMAPNSNTLLNGMTVGGTCVPANTTLSWTGGVYTLSNTPTTNGVCSLFGMTGSAGSPTLMNHANTPMTSAGIFIEVNPHGNAATDNIITGGFLNGNKIGIYTQSNGAMFSNMHIWNEPQTQGGMNEGVRDAGIYNRWSAIEVDSPQVSAFHMTTTNTWNAIVNGYGFIGDTNPNNQTYGFQWDQQVTFQGRQCNATCTGAGNVLYIDSPPLLTWATASASGNWLTVSGGVGPVPLQLGMVFTGTGFPAGEAIMGYGATAGVYALSQPVGTIASEVISVPASVATNLIVGGTGIPVGENITTGNTGATQGIGGQGTYFVSNSTGNVQTDETMTATMIQQSFMQSNQLRGWTQNSLWYQDYYATAGHYEGISVAGPLESFVQTSISMASSVTPWNIMMAPGPMMAYGLTGSPAGQLNVEGPDGASSVGDINSTGMPSIFQLNRGNGTAAALTSVQNGDILGQYVFGGLDSSVVPSAISTSAYAQSVATQNWSGGVFNRGSDYEIWASPNGNGTFPYSAPELEATLQNGFASGTGVPQGKGTVNGPNGIFTGATQVVTGAGALTPASAVAKAYGGTGGVTGQAASTNLSLPYEICSRYPNASTSSLTEANLDTCTLPAGIEGVNGRLEVRSTWIFTGTAGAKYQLARLSASAGASGTVVLNYNSTAADTWQFCPIDIFNEGSNSTQIGNGSCSNAGSVTTSFSTPAINTGNAHYLNMDGEVANAGDSVTLKSWSVTVHPNAGN